MDISYIKQAKNEKGLTMQQLADLSGIPKRTIENLFCGRTACPSFELIIFTQLKIVSKILTQTQFHKTPYHKAYP